MARSLELNVAILGLKSKVKILVLLYADTPSSVTFPVLEGLDELSVSLCLNPALVQVTPHMLENISGQARER